MNLSPCGSGLVLHQTTASGMGFYIRRMMLWGHTAVQTKHAVSQAPWGRRRVENCLENTFITNFRNATFKVQQEGAAVFMLTASKVLLWQEGRWVGRVFAHSYPFPWAAKVRGGGQMEAVLLIGQLCCRILSSSHGGWLQGRCSRISQGTGNSTSPQRHSQISYVCDREF